MPDIIFKPFDKQQQVLDCESRVIGIAASKRSGKSEVGAIKSILWQEQKPTNRSLAVDPYVGVIISPTYDMLNRLSWKKFKAYAKPFIKEETRSPKFIRWWDDSEIYGISADKPERLEGIKADWVWIDEVMLCDEQIYLEAQARVSDTKGYILLTGSLGVQFVNPRTHWFYKHFVENKGTGVDLFTWSTSDNPHFHRDELVRMKDNLDAVTYSQMFEINWDVNSSNMVYADFSTDNLVKGYKVNPNLPILISIDWGWRHKMACLFAQYDQSTDTVIVFDEIVESKLTLEGLLAKIRARNLPISAWCCDIAGNQEREMVGISNVHWFRDRGVTLQFRKTAVLYGVALVRSYVKTAAGRVRLIIAEDKCPQTVDAIKRYRYPEKDGISAAEVPVKEDDDAVDALRYLFVNFIDKDIRNRSSKTIKL